MDYYCLGKNIKTARKAKFLTQETLAEKIDVSPVFISQLETGARMPSLETLCKIADVLKISLDKLVFGESFGGSDSVGELKSLLAGRTEFEIVFILNTVKFLLEEMDKYYQHV